MSKPLRVAMAQFDFPVGAVARNAETGDDEDDGVPSDQTDPNGASDASPDDTGGNE